LANALRIGRFGLWLARAAAVVSIVVLICVPALTRVGQRLETASHAPSFAKNVDCPPKKVTVAPAATMASPVPRDDIELVPVVRLAPSVAKALPRTPQFDLPVPLRAPPAVLFA
jgi:hypothetical protein